MSLEHADIACVEVERKLSHAVRFSRAHCYVDALRSNNNKSLYIMRRQAILCMTLHNIAILKRYLALLVAHHHEIMERMHEAGCEVDALC